MVVDLLKIGHVEDVDASVGDEPLDVDAERHGESPRHAVLCHAPYRKVDGRAHDECVVLAEQLDRLSQETLVCKHRDPRVLLVFQFEVDVLQMQPDGAYPEVGVAILHDSHATLVHLRVGVALVASSSQRPHGRRDVLEDGRVDATRDQPDQLRRLVEIPAL